MEFPKVIFLVLICCFTQLIVGCKTAEQSQELPKCLSSKIETLKNQPVQNPPAEVWKWQTESKTYYYFNAACCDQFSTLYNEVCEIVCAPSGGFTGKGDGKCPDIESNVKRTLIWKDERK